MYICICRKISDHAIINAIEHGADNRVALINALGVGTGCGKCLDAVDELISEYAHHSKNAGVPQATPTLFIPKTAA